MSKGITPSIQDRPELRKERERWDTIARTMPDLMPAFSTQYYRRREIALIQQHFGLLEGKRVLKLDLWNEAVNTRLLQWIESQGTKAFGFDISHVTASRAYRNCQKDRSHIYLAQGDIRHIPFKSNCFDFVYSMGTIEHIDEYQDALREVHRVLESGGKAIIGVPHKWNLFLRPLLVGGLEWFHRYPYSPEKSFSHREIRRVLETTGFSVQARTGLLAFPGILRMTELFLLRRDIRLYKVLPLLFRPFEYLETRWEWARAFGYLIALVVEKPPALVRPGPIEPVQECAPAGACCK
ncbi:MAG: class I SAM-dependent methyltransferase [Acidobacteria bacterium]|nr:class I SAM-dependent methyltransferase [Acidobacteriota bacterium]